MIQQDLKQEIRQALNVLAPLDGFTHILQGSNARYVIGLTNNRVSSTDEALVEKLYMQAKEAQKRYATVTIGKWIDDDGVVYIDIGTMNQSLASSLLIAEQYGQKCVWDSEERQEISVK